MRFLTQIKRFRKIIIHYSFVHLLKLSAVFWNVVEFRGASVICQWLTLFKCLTDCASIASVEDCSGCFLWVNGVLATCFDIWHYLLVKIIWNHLLSSYWALLWLLWRNSLNCLCIRMCRYIFDFGGLQAVVFTSLLRIRSRFDWGPQIISSFTNVIVDFIGVASPTFTWRPTNWYCSSWTSFINWFICKAKFKDQLLSLFNATSQTWLLWLLAAC